MLVTLIVFIFILGLLIFVHELGHFIAAKRGGIKVEEFAFGFPPRIFAIKKGETEYALNLLPFGGYVRMLGESDEDSPYHKKDPRSYAHQSVWTRSKVVVAGVIMNFILAWFLITIGYMIGMPPVVTEPTKIPHATITSNIVVGGIQKDSAADHMGLKPNDQIVAFNEATLKTKDDLVADTKANKGKSVSITINRGGDLQTINGVLGDKDPALGVQLSDDTSVRLPVWWAPIYSVWETIKAMGLIFSGVMGFFKQLVSQHHIPADAAGPVGIYYITRSVLQLGFGAMLNFVAILSVNLGIINILPVPALDGGRLLFIILEKLNGNKKLINARIENWAHAIGFVLLVIMILAITYNDILKLHS